MDQNPYVKHHETLFLQRPYNMYPSKGFRIGRNYVGIVVPKVLPLMCLQGQGIGSTPEDILNLNPRE